MVVSRIGEEEVRVKFKRLLKWTGSVWMDCRSGMEKLGKDKIGEDILWEWVGLVRRICKSWLDW